MQSSNRETRAPRPGKLAAGRALAALAALVISQSARPAAVAAQTAPAVPDTLRLSLAACQERAIAVGEEMRIANAEYEATIGIYRQARSDVLPHLTLNSSYARQFESVFRNEGNFSNIAPFEPDTLATLEQRVRDLERALPTAPFASLGGLFDSGPFASEHTYIATLGLTQKVFEGGALWGAVKAARHALQSYDARRIDRESEVKMLVREAYLGALLADRGVEIAELALQQAATQLQRVRVRQEAGQSAEFDLLQAEVQHDNQLPVVKQAHNRRAVAYLQLCGIANLPANVPLRLTTPLLSGFPVPDAPMAGIDTTGIFASALANPNIEALDEEWQARRAGITVAGRDAWPAISLFANWSEQAFPHDSWPSRDDWARDVNAGVRVDWTIFDGLNTSGAKHEARARAELAAGELASGREMMQLLVARELGELERAAADLRARGRTESVAKRAVDLAGLRYEEGASSLLEVEDARTAYQVAQGSVATARHDLCVALARLERYSGRPLFTELAQRLGE